VSRRRDREAPCPLCHGGAARYLLTKGGSDVVRCRACGLIFVWPCPTAEELEALYSAGGYHADVDESERRRTFAARLARIEGLAPRRGRLLDVGCSRGLFVEVARAEGWDATGVDLNRNAVGQARERGLDVQHGDLADQDYPEGSFDVVTLFDLVEHTGDPRALLTRCHALLRPGGLLVVTTPDASGLLPRVTWALFGSTMGAWDHPTPPGHLVQFSRGTLGRLLGECNYEVAEFRSEHIPMSYSIGKLENAVIDRLTGRHRERPQPRPDAAAEPPSRANQGGPARGLARLAVRTMSIAIVGAVGLAARVTRWGDSMWVIARR
jgi:SAM-dependent methyltransferase